jgi:hypothetical protein
MGNIQEKSQPRCRFTIKWSQRESDPSEPRMRYPSPENECISSKENDAFTIIMSNRNEKTLSPFSIYLFTENKRLQEIEFCNTNIRIYYKSNLSYHITQKI